MSVIGEISGVCFAGLGCAGLDCAGYGWAVLCLANQTRLGLYTRIQAYTFRFIL